MDERAHEPQSADERPADASAASESELERLFVAVQAQLDRLRSLDEATAAESRRIEGELERLSERQAEIQEKEKDVTDALRSIEQGRVDVQNQRTAIQADRAALEKDRERLAADRAALDRQRQELAQRSATLEARQRELDEAKTVLEADRASDETRPEVEALQARLTELEGERDRLRGERDAMKQKLAAAPVGEAATAEAEAEHQRKLAVLKQKAQVIQSVAAHLQRRRARLRRVRAALRERSKGAGAGHVSSGSRGRHGMSAQSIAETEVRATQIRALDEKRRELLKMRELMARSEEQLVRRWARGRSITIVGWLAMLLLLAGLVAHGLTEQIFPPSVVATTTFEVDAGPGRTLSAEKLESWQDWHRSLVRSESFLTELAQRCAELRMEPYGTRSTLEARLERDLSVDAAVPGHVTLALAGMGEAATLDLLDVIASTIAAESSRQRSQRLDGARTRFPDERIEAGRPRYARIAPDQGAEEAAGDLVGRLLASALLARVAVGGGVLVVLLTLAALVYLKLLRAKRVFEAQIEIDPEDLASDEPESIAA